MSNTYTIYIEYNDDYIPVITKYAPFEITNRANLISEFKELSNDIDNNVTITKFVYLILENDKIYYKFLNSTQPISSAVYTDIDVTVPFRVKVNSGPISTSISSVSSFNTEVENKYAVIESYSLPNKPNIDITSPKIIYLHKVDNNKIAIDIRTPTNNDEIYSIKSQRISNNGVYTFTITKENDPSMKEYYFISKPQKLGKQSNLFKFIGELTNDPNYKPSSSFFSKNTIQKYVLYLKIFRYNVKFKYPRYMKRTIPFVNYVKVKNEYIYNGGKYSNDIFVEKNINDKLLVLDNIKYFKKIEGNSGDSFYMSAPSGYTFLEAINEDSLIGNFANKKYYQYSMLNNTTGPKVMNNNLQYDNIRDIYILNNTGYNRDYITISHLETDYGLRALDQNDFNKIISKHQSGGTVTCKNYRNMSNQHNITKRIYTSLDGG
jgi:hypothetical protein